MSTHLSSIASMSHFLLNASKASDMYVFSIAAGGAVSLFVCLHRLTLAPAGIWMPGSAQVELFSEPLRSILQASDSFDRKWLRDLQWGNTCLPPACRGTLSHTQTCTRICTPRYSVSHMQTCTCMFTSFKFCARFASHIPPARYSRIT